jgi:flagellar P-ring protein precursor FlgI
MLQRSSIFVVLGLVFISSLSISAPVRIKDAASIRGVRSNQLVGYGLVVGLQGTGDSSASLTTNSAVTNMVKNLGLEVAGPLQANGAMAGVIITAELPPFARSGEKIDVKISTIGEAKSLAGGTLLLSPLKSGDGQVYAFAQGAVVVGQADGKGARVLTVAQVPGGGVIEREFAPTFVVENSFKLVLGYPDFSNATRMAEAVNTELSGFFAKAVDPGLVTITIPPLYIDNPIEFVARIQSLKVDLDIKAMVTIDERTGTIIMGESVTIKPVTISHGNLTVKVEDKKSSKGEKNLARDSVVDLKGTTVGDIVKSLNSMGARPNDIIGIMKALSSSGALQADLKFL